MQGQAGSVQNLEFAATCHNGDGITPWVYDKHPLIVEKWDVYNLLGGKYT